MKALICNCSSGVYSHLVGAIVNVSYFNSTKLMLAGQESKNIMLFNKADIIILED